MKVWPRVRSAHAVLSKRGTRFPTGRGFDVRVFAVCQDELVIRSLDEVLLPSFEVDFLVESRPLARRLHDAGIAITAGDPRRVDTYLKADITPNTCFIVEDNGRRSIKKIVDAVRDAGGTLIYVLHTGKRGGQRPRRRARRRRRSRTSSCRTAAADPGHRAEPIDDARARPAVPALFRRRRPRPDPAPQRSRPRRAGQRSRAAQPAAPDEDDGDHRRDARA